jgi:hypothetical protein
MGGDAVRGESLRFARDPELIKGSGNPRTLLRIGVANPARHTNRSGRRRGRRKSGVKHRTPIAGRSVFVRMSVLLSLQRGSVVPIIPRGAAVCSPTRPIRANGPAVTIHPDPPSRR